VTEPEKASVELFSELFNKVPEDQRKIVAAQMIGTIQGVMLANSMNGEKKSA
jgi:predicted SnoaL-like aldol condensation-catalyzing enzyme